MGHLLTVMKDRFGVINIQVNEVPLNRLEGGEIY